MKKIILAFLLPFISETTSFGQYNSDYCPVTHTNYKDNYLSFTQVLPGGAGWKSTWWDYGYPDRLGGYHDLSMLILGECTLGDSISIHIKSTRKDSLRPFYYYLFIDWNNDVDFLDEGERINASGAITSKEYIFKVKIPERQDVLGNRVFRVRMSSENLDAFGQNASCVIAGDGETENLLLQIKSPVITSTEDKALTKITAKQVNSKLVVTNPTMEGATTILRAIDGKPILQDFNPSASFSIDLSGIDEGIYMMELINFLGENRRCKIYIDNK